MNIQFEAPDKVNGLMTITLETADYLASVHRFPDSALVRLLWA